jgi:hypothetical protein
MSIVIIKGLVRVELYSSIICRQHIIDMHSFTPVTKDLIVQEYLHDRYGRNNLYTTNKDL